MATGGAKSSIQAIIRKQSDPPRMPSSQQLLGAQQIGQCCGFDRFHQMMVEARGQGLILVIGLTPSAGCDQKDGAPPWLCAHLTGQLEAIHAGHGDIQDHDVRMEVAGDIEGGLAIVRNTSVVPFQAKDQREAARGVDVVIGDEYFATTRLVRERAWKAPARVETRTPL